MKKSMFKKMWLGYIICILVSCHDFTVDELLTASEQLEIDGREYFLETVLWRNFMPVCPPDGYPLYGIIYIIAADSLQFPSSLDADHVWVIKDNAVWDTDLINREIPYGQEYKMQKRTKEEGPKWGPGIYVDVVVRVVNDGDSAYLLRADSQYISRLD